MNISDNRGVNRGNTYLEVRCCCSPKVIYGWMPIDRMVSKNERLRFAMQNTTDRIDLEVDVLHRDGRTCPEVVGPHLARYALKYDDESISKEDKVRNLSLVPGFIPNPTALDIFKF